MHWLCLLCFCLIITPLTAHQPKVMVGVDVLTNNQNYSRLLANKRIGIITNHTAINADLMPTKEILKKHAAKLECHVHALFAPEHGITGSSHASENILDEHDPDGIPIYSLHGKTRRPTAEMLKQVDLLIYDIQDIGSRSYTYITTLFYAMEEAAKHQIPVMVLDRPNPINGVVVDGPMLEEKWRSMVGYINVPYCHGMTVGELAQYFNSEYKIGCNLTVVPMKGWNREMSFHETGLPWVPTSPCIPENTSPLYYPMTGILGELHIVNIGIGYTLPFKVVGAPWINAEIFAKHLNAQNFPGVHFLPFYFKPFYGRAAQEDCQGVQIIITDAKTYQPVCTQYLIIGILKSLYPAKMKEALASMHSRKKMFCQVTGGEEIYRTIQEENYFVWKLKAHHAKERDAFLISRKKYLIY